MLVLCVCVCLFVPTRSRKRNVVSPCFFRRRKEILLASCTNCFSSLYTVWFERKSVLNLSTGYALEPVHTRYTSQVNLGRMNLPHRLNAMEQSRRSRVP